MSDLKPSGISATAAQEVVDKALAEGRAPTVDEIALAMDVLRAAEHKESARAAIRSIVQAQLEVINQCVDLVEKANRLGLVTPGSGPRSKIAGALKMMRAEADRLRGIEDYQNQPEPSPIIAPPANVLPKGKLT